jgi:hypothetical protein
MKALSECITDGTALPGTYAGADDALLEDDEGEIGNMQLAETLSVALNSTRARHKVVDTTWKARRISLKSVKSVEDLQTLERSLGHAISDAIENMELAFGSVLEKFQWTTEQHDQYFTGGLLPFIGVRSMRLYADLVRELACRSGTYGWERTKLDVKYFYDKLYRIRSSAPCRLMVICRTYVCLREEKKAHFHSMERYATHFTALYSRLDQPVGSTVTPCAKCKQPTLHLGGRAACPFKNLTDGKARVAGTFAAEQVSGGMSKTRAYEAALAEVQ